MAVFKKSFWAIFSFFWGILMVILIVGTPVAEGYAGQINGFLGLNSYKVVDDDDNSTPDVMYYKSDYIQWRWYLNPDTGLYEFQTASDSDGAHQHSIDVGEKVDVEGSVMLWNNNQALPLASGSKVSLFGTSTNTNNYLASGEGSGHHLIGTEDTFAGCLEDKGIEANPALVSVYNRYATRYRSVTTAPDASDPNYYEFKINEMPLAKIKDAADSSVEDYSDSAIYVISRLGSEAGDTDFSTSECVDNNYMDLSNDECEILDYLRSLKAAGKIKSIVLILNTCNAMQFKHIKDYDIDACLWVGNGGTACFRALADILSGSGDPSGHLADTYLFDSRSAPATVNFGDYTFTESSSGLPADATYTHNTKYVVYQEGIYVGYKYYETRYEDMVLNQGNAKGNFGVKNSASDWSYKEEVAYPFGFGTSYATFSQSNFRAVKKGDNYICSIDIKNTSDKFSGKDVFEVYLQKPYTDYDKQIGIEKSAVELAGFAKTPELAPGETATLNVTVQGKDLACYDSYGKQTYILEKGDYYLACGEDSHDAINNILAAKGASASAMDEPGDASKAAKFIVNDDDYTTYSVSSKTGNKITNRLDNADINLYEHTADQKIKYLSRNDWASTYPTSPVKLKCTDKGMVYDMQYGHDIASDASVPAVKYNQKNNISLISLINEDYDSEKWDLLLDEMSYSEQTKLTTWGANAVAGASSISAIGGKVGDGPAGMRDAPNTVCYPGNTTLACTYNIELGDEYGNAFGMEMMDKGYLGIYGPGADIHRTNFSGRNWEYFSEDGYLTGIMLNVEVKGMRNRGIIPFEKHFVLNDQERNRYGGTVWANEQTIREIYLKGFQASIEDGDTVGLMSSFNRVGCTWAGAHKGLMTDILRGEWGFKGVCETDAAVGDHMTNYLAMVNGIAAGQDLWMMGTDANVYGNYKDNTIIQQAIRTAVKHNLWAQLHSYAMNGLKSGTKVVELTPWWKTMLHQGIIWSSVVFGVGILMTAASFALPYILKKKPHPQETEKK